MAEAEKNRPHPPAAVLFYGSSSIRLWTTLAADFAHLPVVNHGFGGSTLAECVQELDRLVFPVNPRAVVLYAGDNDLDQGTRPEGVAALLEAFVDRTCARLGPTPIFFLAIKPSPVRFWNIGNIRRANDLARGVIAERWPYVHFVDVFHPMLNGTGEPRRELFTEDGLHMNRAGYELWTTLVGEALSRLPPPPRHP